jgi:alcohol dehydrogenase class IV
MPTAVEVGIGLASRIGSFLQPYAGGHVLVVTDPGIRRAGLLADVERSLQDAGIAFTVFDEVDPNPTAESMMKGAGLARQLACSAVLAVGGGSSIDSAKGIGIMAGNAGHILDYEGVGRIPNPGLPVVAVPTTAGTGSEVTSATIVTNTRTHFKAAVISPHLYPKLAVLDPALTERLPAGLTAATGMDALTHAIESYTSKAASPVSRALAIEAARMIGRNLLDTYYVGTNLASRENMLVASMMAGAAFSQSRLGNVHAISHTLGGVFNIPHGIANAALLPFVMRFNLPACPERMKEIAEALGEDTAGLPVAEAAEKAVQAVVRLNRAMNIPLNIRDLGVTLDAMPKLVEDAMRSGNVLVNPRLTAAADIRRIIESAYHGNL